MVPTVFSQQPGLICVDRHLLTFLTQTKVTKGARGTACEMEFLYSVDKMRV